MADVTFVLVIVGFFGLAYLLVRACERIIGSEEEVPVIAEPSEERLAA
jgi:hypothetical protein